MTHKTATEWLLGIIFVFTIDILFVIGAVVLFFWLNGPARAHDDADWIQQQKLRNTMGEYCCGVGDCHPVDKVNFTADAGGYTVTIGKQRAEHIPYGEVMPLSIDGRLWICRRPDRTRRCVFDQPPGT